MEPDLSAAFREAARDIGVDLGERELLLFAKYGAALRLWNEKMNLVSVHDEADLYFKHFLDALTPVPLLPNTSLRILDIGTGPGLPGIPMKIAVDAWHLSLLEASRKRTSFMKDAIGQLALKNISVIHDRVEALIERGQEHQSFDAVISRATFKLPQLIKIACHFINPGGRLVAMKGLIPEPEWVEAVQVSEKTGLLHDRTHEIFLPASNTPRKILIYKKLK